MAGTGAVLLAGCTGGDGGDGGSSDLGGGGPTPIELHNDRDTTNEDQYRHYPVSILEDATVRLDCFVRDGPAVDFFFTSEDEFSEYEAGNRFQYNQELSAFEATSLTDSEDLASDDYVFVVDNTDRLEAQPPSNFDEDPVDVEVTITATPL